MSRGIWGAMFGDRGVRMTCILCAALPLAIMSHRVRWNVVNKWLIPFRGLFRVLDILKSEISKFFPRR